MSAILIVFLGYSSEENLMKAQAFEFSHEDGTHTFYEGKQRGH